MFTIFYVILRKAKSPAPPCTCNKVKRNLSSSKFGVVQTSRCQSVLDLMKYGFQVGAVMLSWQEEGSKHISTLNEV